MGDGLLGSFSDGVRNRWIQDPGKSFGQPIQELASIGIAEFGPYGPVQLHQVSQDAVTGGGDAEADTFQVDPDELA